MTVQALRARRPESLADLLDAHGREIQGVAFLILRDLPLAEDVTIETLLTAFDKAGSIRDERALRPWLLRVATNKALSVRRASRRVVTVADWPDRAAAGDHAAETADHLALLAGVAALPIQMRAALVLATTPTCRSTRSPQPSTRAPTRSRPSSRPPSIGSGGRSARPRGRMPRRSAVPDDALERRLRSALRTEADGLGLTITAAELDRRHALRGRQRSGRPLLLLLAAAISLAVVGGATLIGGWLDRDEASIVPSPPPGVPVEASDRPSPSGPGRLPDLDDLVGSVDPATVFRANAVGPGLGPLAGEPGVGRFVRFAPVPEAGTYWVLLACLGPSPVSVGIANGGSPPTAVTPPIACDGSIDSRDVQLQAGDVIEVRGDQVSWRVLIQLPRRSGAEPRQLAAIEVADDQVVLLESASDRIEPQYGEAPPAGPTIVTTDLDGLPSRGSYRVHVACAGPGSIRYVLRVDDGRGVVEEPTVSACDGSDHVDRLGLPLTADAVSLSVTADTRIAWHVVVTADPPPITLAPDAVGWQLSIATGPDFVDRTPHSLSGLIEGRTREIRVAIGCLGGATVEVSVTTGRDVPVGAFQATCREGEASTTAQSFRLPDRSFVVTAEPDGQMWLAVTVQEPVGSPGPS